jgi:hypothetical protein
MSRFAAQKGSVAASIKITQMDTRPLKLPAVYDAMAATVCSRFARLAHALSILREFIFLFD